MKPTWPELNFEQARATYLTLHLWTQIVGKIQLATLPWINHSWHVALHVTPSGLTTSTLPYKGEHFQIAFDFVSHRLTIVTSLGGSQQFDLESISVARFYAKVFDALESLGIKLKINPVPSEMEHPVPFPDDNKHATYIRDHVKAFHKVLLHTQRVLKSFRAGFHGKCSPVHFFWGSFDMAFSRFSGRPAPEHPGGIPNLPDWVAREAYSHEVSSCGFWAGNDAVPFAAFYAYIYPEPAGFKEAAVKPREAYYNHNLGEFILPYESVQQSQDPDETLLSFFQSTYDSCAHLAKWDGKLVKGFQQEEKTTQDQ